jgi:hypothetical protein
MVIEPRGEMATVSTKTVGNQGWVIWLTEVNHQSVVSGNRPKVLTGLNQNGKWTGTEAGASSVADAVPPAYRWNLSHPEGTYAQRAKPVSLPQGKASRKASR